MNIGQAATRTGLGAKTIRYYEEMGLVSPARADNGYRDYSAADVERLAFLKRARGLGFTIEESRKLVALHDDSGRASRDVRALAQQHIGAIEAEIRQLEEMRDTLARLVDACPGDGRPECAILREMAGEGETARRKVSRKLS